MALTRLPHTDVLELSVPVTTILTEGLEVPLPEEVAIGRGAIEGTVVSKGFPLIGVTVAMCAHPKRGKDSTPCDGALFRRVVATDDEGNFRMDGVPVGAYRLSVRHAGRWIIGDAVVGRDMRHGQVKDAGVLVVTESEMLQVQRAPVSPAEDP
jgi:hypothetical protein